MTRHKNSTEHTISGKKSSYNTKKINDYTTQHTIAIQHNIQKITVQKIIQAIIMQNNVTINIIQHNMQTIIICQTYTANYKTTQQTIMQHNIQTNIMHHTTQDTKTNFTQDNIQSLCTIRHNIQR